MQVPPPPVPKVRPWETPPYLYVGGFAFGATIACLPAWWISIAGLAGWRQIGDRDIDKYLFLGYDLPFVVPLGGIAGLILVFLMRRTKMAFRLAGLGYLFAALSIIILGKTGFIDAVHKATVSSHGKNRGTPSLNAEQEKSPDGTKDSR